MASLGNILAYASQALQVVEGLVPEIKLLADVAGLNQPKVGTIVATTQQLLSAATDLISNIEDLVADGTIIASATTEAEINMVKLRLASQNDVLRQLVDAS